MLGADAFGREVSGGFGSAEVGGAWATSGSRTSFAVTGGSGSMTTAAGASGRAALTGVSAQDVDVRVDVVLPEMPTGGGTYVSLGARDVDATRYKAQLHVGADGTTRVDLFRVENWVETSLGGVRLPERYTAGTALTVRLEVTGTGTSTLRAKVWAAGTAEPDWQVETTDTTAALQRPGGVFLGTYLSSSATRAVAVRFDQLAARPIA